VGSVEEAAGLLQPEDEIVLALPIELVLAQRMRLPTTDPSEFGEMVRIQIEKAMPYSPEEMTTDSVSPTASMARTRCSFSATCRS